MPQGGQGQAEHLLADIDQFVEAVRRGDYFEEWEWDDDIHDERAYGDESWVEGIVTVQVLAPAGLRGRESAGATADAEVQPA